jgi:hypothetical protein
MQNVSVNQEKAPVALKWDPKNLEIKTRSVERTLEPLVIQVRTMTYGSVIQQGEFHLVSLTHLASLLVENKVNSALLGTAITSSIRLSCPPLSWLFLDSFSSVAVVFFSVDLVFSTLFSFTRFSNVCVH